jgi:hypothetical protein
MTGITRGDGYSVFPSATPEGLQLPAQNDPEWLRHGKIGEQVQRTACNVLVLAAIPQVEAWRVIPMKEMARAIAHGVEAGWLTAMLEVPTDAAEFLWMTHVWDILGVDKFSRQAGYLNNGEAHRWDGSPLTDDEWQYRKRRYDTTTRYGLHFALYSQLGMEIYDPWSQEWNDAIGTVGYTDYAYRVWRR